MAEPTGAQRTRANEVTRRIFVQAKWVIRRSNITRSARFAVLLQRIEDIYAGAGGWCCELDGAGGVSWECDLEVIARIRSAIEGCLRLSPQHPIFSNAYLETFLSPEVLAETLVELELDGEDEEEVPHG